MLIQACVACMAGVKMGRGKGEKLERKKGEEACIMVVSYLIHVNKLLIVAQPIRHLRIPAGQGPQKLTGVSPQSTLSFPLSSHLIPSFHPCHAS